ncbi:MAG: cation transporter, partial [Halobaculum sp.]
MSTRTASLELQGMSCANCAGTVADAVESLSGVDEASINYA